MSGTADQDPLKPALEKAQAELAKHLDEACDTDPEDAAQGSAEELLRLEEELLAAARAADEAARLQRRLEQRAGETEASSARPTQPSTAPPPPEAGGRVREFRDREGLAWRVWEVRPGIGRPLSHLHRYLGDYVHGWLAFGCLDNELRRRLPKYPPDWLSMSDQELEGLLNGAIDVRRKEPRRPAADVKL